MRPTTTALRAVPDDGAEQEEGRASDADDPDPALPSSTAPSLETLLRTTEWLPQIQQRMSDIAEQVRVYVQTLPQWMSRLPYVLVGFVAGSVICLTALLVPVYSQVETLSQPVTLFETILGDLQQAYVDEVDVEKLLETSVSAMLRSLDPYTEFESKQAARDLTESIDGRYAGVGLVIAGQPPSMSSSRRATPDVTATPTLLPQTPPGQNPSAQDDPAVVNPGSDDLSSSSSPTGTGINIGSAASDVPSRSDGLGLSSTDEDVVDDKYDKAANEDSAGDNEDGDEEDEDVLASESRRKRRRQANGIRVVSAFEGYAFDYGLRVGDQLVAVDHVPVEELGSIDKVRNALRGEPGTWVTIDFVRQKLDGVQSVTIPRTVVRIRDVKLATLIQPNVGYIQLSGFASETGKEMRQAITYLQQTAIDSNSQLEGLVLDLRSNPGGLLTSAVDVASLFVPKGSDIVSAKGRGFPGVLYRSRVEPLLDDSTKLAVLVNGGTASAAEIVAGAIQDLDVGVIVGSDRTYGKGLVQNVQELPFDTALKFTVAKYYTPSGRCIQGVTYKEGGGLTEDSARFVAQKVADKDRSEFYTRNGRIVKDGGGIEADIKVEAPKASALEITLLRSGVFTDFAAEWSKSNELTTTKNLVDEDTYKKFIAFVNQKQRAGDLQLEELYERSLADLKKTLKKSGYMGSEKLVEQLQASIVREMQKDFAKYRGDISEDIAQNILARYLPESMLIERGIQGDRQVDAAVKLVTSNKFDRVLARTDEFAPSGGPRATSDPANGWVAARASHSSSSVKSLVQTSSASNDDDGISSFRATIQF